MGFLYTVRCREEKFIFSPLQEFIIQDNELVHWSLPSFPAYQYRFNVTVHLSTSHLNGVGHALLSKKVTVLKQIHA